MAFESVEDEFFALGCQDFGDGASMNDFPVLNGWKPIPKKLAIEAWLDGWTMACDEYLKLPKQCEFPKLKR